MNVQVNITKAVSAVKAFLQSHGGDAKHSEVLELVAGVCGFHNYRAMLAVTGEKPAKNKKPDASSEGSRSIENEENVVFRTTVEDWDKEEHPNSTRYDFIVENNGENFRVLMKPQGIHLDNFQGQAILDVNFEVNKGVPCAHMTNDSADCMAVTVFGTGGGLLVRPDDCEWMQADSVGVPSVLGELAVHACHDKQLHEAFAAVLNTEVKYSEEDEATSYRTEQGIRQYVELCVADALDDVDVSSSTQRSRDGMFAKFERHLSPAARAEGDRRVKVVLSNQTHTASGAPLEQKDDPALPKARAPLAHPIKRKDVGGYVEVSFADDVADDSAHLWVDVDLHNQRGHVEDDDHVGMLCNYEKGTAPRHLRALADHLAILVAFFVEAGRSMGELESIIVAIVECPVGEPHDIAKACVELAQEADDKHIAYDQVLRKLHPVS